MFFSTVCVWTGEGELVCLVESCWSKVMAERQHTLEETYKLELSATNGSETGSVSMADISPLWEETAHKAWQLHTGQPSPWLPLSVSRCPSHLNCWYYLTRPSESQRKKVGVSSQKKLDVISSAVRSVLTRPGRESLTVEVNTFIRTMRSPFPPGVLCIQKPELLSQSRCCVCAVGRPALWGCLIISLNRFGLSQLIAPEWA